MFPGAQVCLKRIGHAPYIESTASAMRHHHSSQSDPVYIEGADCTLVLRIDRTVGIAIDEVDQVATILRNVRRERDVGISVQGKIDIPFPVIAAIWTRFNLTALDVRKYGRSEIAYRLACKGLITVLSYSNHLILTV